MHEIIVGYDAVSKFREQGSHGRLDGNNESLNTGGRGLAVKESKKNQLNTEERRMAMPMDG